MAARSGFIWGRRVRTCFLGGRTQSSLAEAAAAAGGAGGKATPVAGTSRDPKQVQALVDRAIKDTGRLDVMVNNAGVEFPSSIVEGDPEQWRAMLETNVLALLAGSQAAVRAMRACGAHGIVNISSSAGRREATGVYGATKWAVNAIATSLRKELENDTIRIVNILPGRSGHQLRAQFSARGREQYRAVARYQGGHLSRAAPCRRRSWTRSRRRAGRFWRQPTTSRGRSCSR